MPPSAFHNSFDILNFTHNSCRNLKKINDKAPESYNILEHAIFIAPPCVKHVNETSTTYRDHYCRKKCAPKPPRSFVPFPLIQGFDDKITAVSTYKDEFHPFSAKDRKEYRGKLIPQKQTLSCPKKKFEAKSETQFSFKCPKEFEKKPPAVTNWKNVDGLFNESQTCFHNTTYSSQFKRPRKYKKTASFVPKSQITVSKEPFRHVSLYRSEFKVPKTKRDDLDGRPRRQSYKPPSVPMDITTTYKSNFTLKTPTSKPLTQRYPDYRCKPCAIYTRNRMKIEKPERRDSISNSGDGDKVQKRKMPSLCPNCRKEMVDCNGNRSPRSDKICDDNPDLKSRKESKGFTTNI